MRNFELHLDLKDASLEAVADMADRLLREVPAGTGAHVLARDISWVLEYLRLNFDLVAKGGAS